jgi:ArsR family transcriptional regulator
VCIDSSGKVVQAATERLRRLDHVQVLEGDMQALPFDKPQFDLVLLMHALTYAERPALAIAEAARVLRKGGRLLATCLVRHEHRGAVTPYGHVNLGFTEKELRKFAAKAGLVVQVCEVVTREKRPPHFEVLTLLGHKP